MKHSISLLVAFWLCACGGKVVEEKAPHAGVACAGECMKGGDYPEGATIYAVGTTVSVDAWWSALCEKENLRIGAEGPQPSESEACDSEKFKTAVTCNHPGCVVEAERITLTQPGTYPITVKFIRAAARDASVAFSVTAEPISDAAMTCVSTTRPREVLIDVTLRSASGHVLAASMPTVTTETACETGASRNDERGTHVVLEHSERFTCPRPPDAKGPLEVTVQSGSFSTKKVVDCSPIDGPTAAAPSAAAPTP